MRHRLFNIISILALGTLGVVLSVFQAGAQQKPADKAAQSNQDEPVAITARAREEKLPESKVVTPEDFANFRSPIINNKGEIAFLALFMNPAAQNNAGLSIFVRQTDGSWKITREGEKAINHPDSIHGFAVPNFNDNGDLTFYSTFGTPGAKPAPQFDPNDPAAASSAHIRNGGIYVKTAQGVKNLVKLGDEVPRMPSHFSGFSNASTNNKGVTAFIGTYSDPDGKGLFMVENGQLRLVVRSGQKVGSTGPEDTFSEHYYPTAINDRNEVAFMARVGEKSGIFVARPTAAEPNKVEMVAFGGRPSPIKGTNYLGFGNRTPAINSKGEVAFAAFFDGPEAGRGLFFKGAGPTQVVARKGDQAGGVGTFEDFLSPSVNARGDVAFIGVLGGRNRGIFIKTAKGIEPVAMVDQKIPGAKDQFEVFTQFQAPSVNDRGEVVFYAQLKNAEVAIFHRDEKGILHVVARRGQKMPK